MGDPEILLLEDNVISLRTAAVQDDGNLASLRLLPASLNSSIPGVATLRPSELEEYILSDSAWLYRHKRSAAGEEELAFGLYATERSVMPIVFERPPEVKLLWAESGHSVAVYLNGEPWAFIYEGTHRGYSKGVLKPTIGNLWNQELFERVFMRG
jgi:hypothetical protein